MPESQESAPPVRFFTYTKTKWQNECILTISFVDNGYMISPNGNLGIKDNYYRQARCLQKVASAWPVSKLWKEIKWEDAIKLINISGREKLAKALNLTLPPPMELDSETKDKLIKFLHKRRAFNGDSAHKCMPSKLPLFETLYQLGLCKSLDGRHFWLNEEKYGNKS